MCDELKLSLLSLRRPIVQRMAVKSFGPQYSQFAFIKEALMVKLHFYEKCCKFIISDSFQEAFLPKDQGTHLSFEYINRGKFWTYFVHLKRMNFSPFFKQSPGM